jgi:hypothetical protein
MSFREKGAWISLLSTAGIYGLYFRSIIHSGHPTRFSFGGLLGTIVALVIVQVVLIIAVAVFTPKEANAPPDEREKMIDLKASRLAYAALSGSVACACFFGGFNPPIIFNVNSLLFILVMAEVLRSSCQIVQYRRGA